MVWHKAVGWGLRLFPVHVAWQASTPRFERPTLLQEINQCHKLGRGPVLLLLFPADTSAQQKGHGRSTSTSKAVMGGWLFPCPLLAQEAGGTSRLPTGHKDPCQGILTPCTWCFDTVQFVPNWGSVPTSLLWAFAISGSVDMSSALRARGSVLQIEDWQLSSCKENDWLYLCLIHCYLVHMHNSCLIFCGNFQKILSLSLLAK